MQLSLLNKIDKLSEEKLLTAITDTNDQKVRIAATAGVNDRDKLLTIAHSGYGQNVSVAALKKIGDAEFVRNEAWKNTADGDFLGSYLKAYGSEEEYAKVSEMGERMLKEQSLSAWNGKNLSGFEKAADIVCRINNERVSATVIALALEKIVDFRKTCRESWGYTWGREDENLAIAVVKMFSPVLTDTVREKVYLQNKLGWDYLIPGTSRELALRLLKSDELRYVFCEVRLVDLINAEDITLELYRNARSKELRDALKKKMPTTVLNAAKDLDAKKIEDLISKAKSHSTETLVFKGLYLGMPIEDAKTLINHYDSTKDYFVKDGNVVCTRLKESIDNDGGVVVKGKNGRAVEFILSRELIDHLFNTKEVSAVEFCKGVVNAYAVIPALEAKVAKVPDWSTRQMMAKSILDSVGQAWSMDDIERKCAQARAKVRTIKTIGKIYCCENSDLSFVLEIMPLEVKKSDQTNFFVLRKIEKANLNSFD